MYCQRCYTDLHPNDPATFLVRPFPRKRRIILHLIATTAIGVLVAGIVALFQTAILPSGH
jgi:hypothetical protein